MTFIRHLRFSIARQMIHLGLNLMPAGRFKSELTAILWNFGAHVVETNHKHREAEAAAKASASSSHTESVA